MNQPLIITNEQARRIFLERQGLSASPRTKLTTDGLLEMIRALGFVQVDSINTVARAHHMILFARNQTYKSKQLKHLLEKDRSLFEHWTHDAAIIPSAYYSYWQHRFKRDRKLLLDRWRKRRQEGFGEVLADVLETVTKNGPTRSKDIGSRKKKATGWWDWHPEKTALEFHWRTGNLAITARDGFQKVYDITTNVIPQADREETVSEVQFIDWACCSALKRLGMATAGEIAAFWDLVTPKEAASWCLDQLGKKNLIEVQIEPFIEGPHSMAVAFADLPDRLSNLPTPPERVRFLSPFDPLIRDRKRCLRLFGFKYRIEVFVPQEKRQYGYYVFPVLEGHKLIGRIDMKRVKDNLVVSGLWLEPGVKLGKGRQAAFEAELDRHRRFVNAKAVTIAPNFSGDRALFSR